MLAVVATEVSGEVTLAFSGAVNEALVEIAEYSYSVVDTTTSGIEKTQTELGARISVIDVLGQNSYLFEVPLRDPVSGAVRPISIRTTGAAGDDAITLETSQAGTTFSLQGIGDTDAGKATGSWQSQSSIVVALNISDLDVVRLRSGSAISLSGDFRNATAGKSFELDATSQLINAGGNGVSGLTVPELSLRAPQINVGNLGIKASDSLVMTSSAGLTVASVAGSIAATKSLSVTALNDISIGPSIDLSSSGGVVSIVSSAGGLSLGGSIKADDAISLQAKSGTSVVGSITSTTGDITVVDLAKVVLGGAIEATTGKVSATSQTGLIEVIGGIASKLGINLTAGGAVDLLSLKTTGLGKIAVVAGGATSIIGSLTTSNGDASIQSTAGLSVGGAVDVGTGSLTLIGLDVSLAVPATVKAAGLTVQSTGAASLGGKITATGAVTVDAAGDVSLAGVQAADSLAITSQAGSVTSSGGITVTDLATIEAATTATINGDLSAGDAKILAVGDTLIGGSLTAKSGDVLVESRGGSATVLGSVEADVGDVAITSNDTTTISGIVTAEGLVAIGGLQAVSVSGGITASTNSIAVASLAGSVSVGGALETKNAGDQITVEGATNVAIGGAIKTNNGAVTLEAATGSLSLSGKIETGAGPTSGNVTLLSGAALTTTVGSTIDAEVIAVTSGTSASLGGALTAVSGLAIKSGGTLSVAGDLATTISGNVALTSTGGGISIAGDVDSVANVIVQSKQATVGITGDIVAADLVAIEAVTSISVAGSIASTNDAVRLTSATGSISGGNIAAFGKVFLTAADTVAGSVVAGDVASAGVVLRAGVNATIGDIDTKTGGGGSVDLEAKLGDMLVTGDILTTSSDNVSLLAGGALTLQTTGLVSAGSIAMTAGKATTINGGLNATNIVSSPVVILSTGDVSVAGDIVADAGTVKITSQTGSLSASGVITAGGGALTTKTGGFTSITGAIEGTSVSVSAVGDVTLIGSTVSTAAEVSIASSAGDVTTAGVTAKTTLDVSATSGDLSVGALTSAGVLTVGASAGKAVFSGPLASGGNKITISAGDSATFNATASVNAGAGDVAIAASGDARTLAGAAILGRAVQIVGKLVELGGTASASDSLAVSATSTATVNAALSAVNSLSISGVAGVAVNAAVASTASSIAVGSSTGDVQVAGSATANTDISVVASLGSVTTVALTSNTAGVTINAGKVLELAGPVSAGSGSVELTGATLTSLATSAIDAESANLRASDTATLNGAITATGVAGIVIQGTNATLVNAPLSASGGSISVASSADALTINGKISAGSGVSVSGVKATAVNGAVTAAGNAVFGSATDTLFVSGEITVGGKFEATARTSVGFGAAVSANVIDARAGTNLLAAGALISSNALSLAAGEALNATILESAGPMTVSAGTAAAGDVILSGNISTSGGALTVAAGSSTTAAGSVSVSGTIDTSGGLVQIGSVGTGEEVSVASIVDAGSVRLSGDKVGSAVGGSIVGASIAVSAIDTATIGGDLLSVGGITVSATNAVAANGAITGASVSLNGSKASVNGAITTTGGAASVSASTDDIVVTKTIVAAGNIALSAAKTVSAVGLQATTAAGSIFVSGGTVAAGNVSLSGGLVTDAGAITIQAGSNNVTGAIGSVSVVGGISSASGNLLIRSIGSDQGVTVTSVNVGTGGVALSADDAVTLVELGSITAGNIDVGGARVLMNGTLVATAAVRLQGRAVVSLAGDVTGASVFGQSTGGSLAAAGKITGKAGGVSLFAGSTVAASQTVSAANDMVVAAGTTVTLSTLSAGGDISVQSGSDSVSGGDISLAGSVQSTGGGVFVQAGANPATGAVGSVSVSGAINTAGGNKAVTVTAIGAGESVSVGSIDAGTGGVSVQADQGAVNLVVDSQIQGGSIKVSAGTTASIGAGLLARTGGLSIAGGASVSSITAVTATLGNVSFQSGGTLSVVGPVSAGAEVSLQAATNVSSAASLTSGASKAALTKAMTITAGTADKSGSASLAGAIATNGGSLTITTGINTPGLAGDIALGATVTTLGGDVSLLAGVPGSGSKILIGSNIAAGVGGDVTASSDIFSLSAGVTISGADIALNANDTATVNGDVTGTGKVGINAKSATSINGFVTSGGQLTLASSEAALNITKAISSGGQVTLQAATTLTLSGSVTAAGTVDVTARDAVNVFKAIASTAGGVEIASSESTVTVNDSVTGVGLVELSANGNVSVGSLAPLKSTAGSISVGSSVGGITINNSVTASVGVTLASPGKILLSGITPVTATVGSVSIASSGSTVTVNNRVLAGTDVKILADGNLVTASAAPLTAQNGDITLDSNLGTIVLGAGLIAGDDVSINALGLVRTSQVASISGGGDVSVTSDAATITIGSKVSATGGSLTLAAEGAVATLLGATLNSGTDLVVRSDSSTIRLTAGATAGGAVDMDAELALSTTVNAPLQAGGVMDLFSQSASITLASTTKAGAAIDIKAGTFVTVQGTAPMESTGASVTITANDGAITLGGSSPIKASAALVIEAIGANGKFTSGINSTLTSTLSDVKINTDAAMLLGVSAGIFAGDEIILEATGGSGSITTSTNATLSAGGDITLRSDASFIKIGTTAPITSDLGGITLVTGAAGVGAITVAGKSDIKASGDVAVLSDGGSVSLSSSVQSTAAKISLVALGGAFTTTTSVARVRAVTEVRIEASQSIQLASSVATDDIGAGIVTLLATKGINQNAADTGITTGILTAINDGPGSVGNITLVSPLNALGDLTPGTFAAFNTAAGGAVTLISGRDLEIGAGDGVLGISTVAGNVFVRQFSDGDIFISQPITTGTVAGLDTANVVLDSFGEIADGNNGRILATQLQVRNLTGTGDILLDSSLNDVVNASIRNFAPGERILYVDATDLTVNAAGEGFRTELGDIAIIAGFQLTLAAEVHAGQATQLLPAIVGTTVSLAATTGISQTASQVVGNNVVLSNVTGPIDLSRPTNDAQQLAAVNVGGAITYVDVNDFETGVTRTANPPGDQPLGYEVITPGVLTLQAGAGGGVAAPSTLRVVSGLRYGSLVLTAGDSKTGDVGTVEYVTTSDGDNTRPGPAGGFSGTLRDMITYSNANRGRQTINGVSRVQPQTAVFDELYYPVAGIVLDAGLPTIIQPLSINGTRVEATVTDFARVGLDGSKIPSGRTVNGFTYGVGSSDSVLTGLAVYGFKTGAGISLASGVNTITNTYAGLNRDGSLYVENTNNLVGIELNGRLSTKNTIGDINADETQANLIGGNQFAGLVIRGGGSSNLVVGNFIGTNAAGDDLANRGDGIRIDGSNTNSIGVQNAQRPNLTAALSNIIRFNEGSGIRITAAQAATRALGNVVQNNLIDSNLSHGIHIVSSSQQSVGGDQPNQGNVIVNNLGAGMYLQSTTGSQITANKIGVGVDFEPAGNAAGIRLQASSSNLINGRNQIGNNLGTAIELLQRSDLNRVEGNFIGFTIDENTDLDAAGNLGSGILIQQSLGNQIVKGNLIGNNDGTGVSIVDAEARTLQQGNVVAGNTITLNGSVAGLLIQGGGFHTIGGAGNGNEISLNVGDGIRVENGSLTGDSVANSIIGNFVGTNQFGEDLLGNTGYGISISYGGRNVIASNLVFNNGVDSANDTTLGFDGIRIAGSSSNTVGSTSLGLGNTVFANGGTGIVVTDAVDVGGFGEVRLTNNRASFTRSQAGKLRVNNVIVIGGNEYRVTQAVNATTFTVASITGGPVTIPGLQEFQIRTPVSNTGNVVYGNDVFDNAGHGVHVAGGLTNLVTVGQIAVPGRAVGGAANSIAGNWGYGVLVTKTSGVTIEGNSIVDNGGLDAGGNILSGGIKLADGANAGAVTPTIISSSVAAQSAGTHSVTVTGTVSAEGTGTVSVAAGIATFSQPQSTLAVNDVVVVSGKAYKVTAKSSSTRFTLAGRPTLDSSTFRVLKANQINQQYTVDVYLNQPWQGDASTGRDYQAAVFLGRTSVLVAVNATGEFTATFSFASENSPLGMFVTATATTTRPATGVVQYSTSELSQTAVMVDLPPTGAAAAVNNSDLARARALAFEAAARQPAPSNAGSASTGISCSAARRNAFSAIGR